VPVALEQSEALSVIRLEGAIGIADAAELKKLLLQALQPGKKVNLLLECAAELDVTAVQLLWAAGREAKRSGVEFTFAGTVPEEISTALGDAGFEKLPVSK
jgi:hypothetical protein